MKYACLVYLDGAAMAGLSEVDGNRLKDDSIAFDWGMRNSGHLIMAQPLDAPKTAVTLRIRQSQASATDGPFMETKEFLGGFFLIEARDLDEAKAIAAKSPILRYGSIEIRPFLDQTHSETGQGRPPVASPKLRS
jgi:hypothetical protein